MEKTLKSYQEKNYRLQLVQMNERNKNIYKIILNRKIEYKSIYFEATIRKFLSILYNKALEQEIFNMYDEEILLNG